MIKIYKGDKKLVSLKLTQFSYIKLKQLADEKGLSKTAYVESLIRERSLKNVE